MKVEDHIQLVTALLSLKGHALLSGYVYPVYGPLEHAGWKRVDMEVVSNPSVSRAGRTESLWISRNYASSVQAARNVPAPGGESKQIAALRRTHAMRVARTELSIRQAIKSISRTGGGVEISRVTGISRMQLHRRYSHLF